MKNANEMNKIAWEVIHEIHNERIRKATELVENKIAKDIETIAYCGGFDYTIKVDGKEVNTDAVVEILTKHGYNVRKSGYTLKISWM